MQPNIIERVWRQDKMVNVDVLNGFVFTGEAEAHKFVISGKNVNTPVDISGTITANFKNANNVLVPLTGTIEDGKAAVVLSQECYAVEGPFSLMIFADTVCIYAAIANVINSSGETIAYPTASIPDIQELIDEAQAVSAQVPGIVSAAQTAVDGIEDQKNTMIASIASVAGQGTDTTLTQSGVAADAKATGDQIGDLKSAFDAAVYNFAQYAVVKSGLLVGTNKKINSSTDSDRVICVPVEANKRYRIKKETSTIMRAGCASSNDAAVGTTLTSYAAHSTASSDELIVETDSTNKYIYIQLFTNSDTVALKTIAANLPSLIVVEDVLKCISNLETDVAKVVKKIIVNTSDYSVTGYYGAKGAFSSTSGFSSTNKIDLLDYKGGTIKGQCKGVSGNLACYTFFKDDNTYLSNYMGTSPYDVENYDIEIPDKARYVAFSKSNSASLNPATIEIDAMRYAKKIEKKIEKELEPYEYFVSYGQNDGVHYFTNLVDCLWDADGKPERNKVINIAQGTYDVLAGLGGMEHINNYSIEGGDTAYDTGVQPWLTNCKIIGWGKVVLNFILDDNTTRDHYWLFSCLNVRGNVEIENIEIHSKNCRYSIHDESSSNFPKTRRKYKNVKCYQNESGGSGGQAIGSGFSVDTIVEIEGCTLISGTASPAWSCHSKGRSELYFKDSIFQVRDGNNVALGISQEGSVYIYAMISNCFLTNKLLVRDEGNSQTAVDKTKIDLINTYVNQIENGFGSTIEEAITSYNTITGEKTILLAPTT